MMNAEMSVRGGLDISIVKALAACVMKSRISPLFQVILPEPIWTSQLLLNNKVNLKISSRKRPNRCDIM